MKIIIIISICVVLEILLLIYCADDINDDQDNDFYSEY